MTISTRWPPGATGEICIFGPQVALGYRGDPQGTADRFVLVDCWGADPVRIYRTGDLARLDDSGAIEFCGRKDRQLKFRGFRIEPGEIEAGLCRHPLVDQAVVTVTGEDSHTHLVAYVSGPPYDLDPSDLRVWLRGLLPHVHGPVATSSSCRRSPPRPMARWPSTDFPPWRTSTRIALGRCRWRGEARPTHRGCGGCSHPGDPGIRGHRSRRR